MTYDLSKIVAGFSLINGVEGAWIFIWRKNAKNQRQLTLEEQKQLETLKKEMANRYQGRLSELELQEFLDAIEQNFKDCVEKEEDP